MTEKISNLFDVIADMSAYAGGDEILMRDVSDTTGDAGGTAKAGTVAGLLAAIPGATNAATLASTGGSLTGSNAQSFLDVTYTWNTTGTPTLVKYNVTDTASNAASLFFDFQAGSVSKAYLSKAGTYSSTLNGALGFQIAVSGQNVVGIGRSDAVGGLNLHGNGTTAQINLANLRMISESTLVHSWSSSNITQNADFGIGRSAAGLGEANNGTAGQWRDFKVRKHFVDQTITAGGTTGNQTIDKAAGTVNIAAAGTTVTVTCNQCTTSSTVHAVIRTNDSTARIANVVPGSGSFVINIVACTAEVSIGWLVVN